MYTHHSRFGEVVRGRLEMFNTSQIMEINDRFIFVLSPTPVTIIVTNNGLKLYIYMSGDILFDLKAIWN